MACCDHQQQMEILNTSFEDAYAKAMVKLFPDSLAECCYGCITDHFSQLHHQCLMMSKDEQIEFCFDTMLKNVDELDVLAKWSETSSTLDRVSPDVLGLVKLKFSCVDWRATDMKSSKWRDDMMDAMLKLIREE
jgi:hypothetical protein